MPPASSTTLIVALLLVNNAFGQSGRAELFGTVRDLSGLTVPGAAVQAQALNTGVYAKSATNESGEFHFFALPPGDYSVTAAKTG